MMLSRRSATRTMECLNCIAIKSVMIMPNTLSILVDPDEGIENQQREDDGDELEQRHHDDDGDRRQHERDNLLEALRKNS